AVITNDGWWGHSSGHVQHFVLSKLRAVETQRWLVRAANNGISGTISPRGEVFDQTAYWTEASVVAPIRITQRLTLFSRAPYWFVGLCTVLALVMVVVGRVKARQ
ncbi:nitrilase-related carbon-nitrogen hydrolase, partial [Arthrospira platensis SPKY1]|nr:nitrilase-related carbon-nitrogen hydrolase [Arthrospira platensis SPKY1]